MKTIIEMAKEAGLITNYGGREAASDELLERLVDLVRADEREACADIVENWNNNGFPRVAEKIRARGQA